MLEKFQRLSRITGSRKISIKQVRPHEGIGTGTVMAYGHVIRPPYKIEYSGSRLLINGVQVIPSLVKERTRKSNPPKRLSPEKRAVEDKVGELIIVAKKMYSSRKEGSSLEAMHGDILLILGKHPDLIKNPRWQSEVLCYATPAYPFDQCVNFAPSSLPPPEAMSGRESEAKAMQIKQIEDYLKKGDWVCFGSFGLLRTQSDPRKRVNEIMKDVSLSRDQRIELLKERAFKSYDLALDVADNYSQEEWQGVGQE
jgi:hypothetical protein